MDELDGTTKLQQQELDVIYQAEPTADSIARLRKHIAFQAAEYEFEGEMFTEFINKVWKAVYPDNEVGTWDYPAQVLRHLEEELADLRHPL